MSNESESAKRVVFDIKLSTLAKAVGVILFVVFLYYLRDLLVILLAALLLAAIINPLANWFEQRKIPRGLAVIIIYIVLFALLGLIVVVLVPPIISEFSDFSHNLPAHLNGLKATYANFLSTTEQFGLADDVIQGIDDVGIAVSRSFAGVFATVASVVGSVVSIILILVFAFYLVIEKGNLKDMVSFAVPAKYHPHLANYFGQISDKISAWVRGQLLVGLIMGVIVYVGLSILGVKYALIIGLLAALLEFIPFVGPIISAVPAVFLGLTDSPVKAVSVMILFWVANRIENDILIPKIMKHATGLNPVITLIAVAVGFKLGGILGIILAVPTATALGVLVKNYLEQKAQN